MPFYFATILTTTLFTLSLSHPPTHTYAHTFDLSCCFLLPFAATLYQSSKLHALSRYTFATNHTYIIMFILRAALYILSTDGSEWCLIQCQE